MKDSKEKGHLTRYNDKNKFAEDATIEHIIPDDEKHMRVNNTNSKLMHHKFNKAVMDLDELVDELPAS